jgi:hypothetical protein
MCSIYAPLTDTQRTHRLCIGSICEAGSLAKRFIQSLSLLFLPQFVLSMGVAYRPKTILVADSFASLIWRVDLSEDGRSASASIWLKHYSMLYHPGELKPEQPGVNGLRFAKKTSYVYYTSTVLKLFMRVRVDRQTLAPLGVPEYLGGDKMMDDFLSRRGRRSRVCDDSP